MAAAAFVPPSGDYRIDAVLGGVQWDVPDISFSFYAGGAYYGDENGPTPVSEAVKSNVRFILNEIIAPLINVTFTEVADSPTRYGLIRYLCSSSAGYAYASYPGGWDVAGDVVLNPAFDVAGTDSNSFQMGPGSHGFQAIAHETCHALGLKHPGDYNGGGTGDPPFLPLGEDNGDNSLMSYNFFSGSEPATPMSYDLLALQYLYGANTATRADDTTYVFTAADDFSPGSGSSGSPQAASGRMKHSLWDGGGIDTIDLSGIARATGGYRVDIRAGGWITTNSSFESVGYDATTGSPTDFFDGTTYVATDFGTRIPLADSVIENIVVSPSSDAIYLNSAANRISGYAPGVAGGADVIYASDNADVLDLTGFTKTGVTESRVGNDLLIKLGTSGTVTVKDYYGVTPDSRLVIRYVPEPTISITSDLTTLSAGDTTTIYFTLGTSSVNFTADDVVVTGGTLDGFTGSGTDYTATFTPAADFAGTATISVAAGAFTDEAGEPSLPGSLQLTIDTIVPTLVIARSGAGGVLGGGATATITFTISEASADFAADDVFVTGGTISGFTGSGASYTATFTPNPLFSGTAVISVPAGAFSNFAGNSNVSGGSLSVDVDTMPPTLAITRTLTVPLKRGDIDTIIFTLDEPSSTFSVADVTVTGGTLTGFAGSGSRYTAAFQPLVGFDGTATIRVKARTFTDIAGNANAVDTSLSISIDAVAPRAPVVALKNDTGKSAVDRITADPTLDVTGIESQATVSYSSDGGLTWLPESTVVSGANRVLVRQTDLAGNHSAAASIVFTYDIVAPAAPGTALRSDTGWNAFDRVTSIPGLVLPGLEAHASVLYSIDQGMTWSGTFAPPEGIGTVLVLQTDAAGNVSAPSSGFTYTYDVTKPMVLDVTSPNADGSYTPGQSIVIVVSLSETIVLTTGAAATLGLNAGRSAVLTTPAGSPVTSLTFVYTIQNGDTSADLEYTGTNAFAVTSGSIRDLAGNDLIPTLPVPVNTLRPVGLGAAPTGMSLGASKNIVIVGPLLASAGFGSPNSTLAPTVKAAVTSIPIRFNTAVSRLSLANFRLMLNNRAVSLKGASLIGGGTSWTLRLPAAITGPKGLYSLQIFGVVAGNGATMGGATAVTQWWRR